MTNLVDRYPNIEADALRVSHAALEKFSEDSDYKVHCPACKTGLLLVFRDPRTMRIQRHDRCISCGQRVEYTDESIGGEKFK